MPEVRRVDSTSIIDDLFGTVAQVHNQMETGMGDNTTQWGRVYLFKIWVRMMDWSTFVSANLASLPGILCGCIEQNMFSVILLQPCFIKSTLQLKCFQLKSLHLLYQIVTWNSHVLWSHDVRWYNGFLRYNESWNYFIWNQNTWYIVPLWHVLGNKWVLFRSK